MPRGRKNRRSGNSGGTNSSGSQQGSEDTTEPSAGETENTTAPSGAEPENTEAPSGAETENPTTSLEAGGSTGTDVSASPISETLNAFGEIDSSAASLASDIESLINDYGRRLRLLSSTKGHLLETSRNLRAEFDQRLDKLQQELTDKVTQTYAEEKKKVETKMEKCVAMKSDMDAARMSAETALISDDPYEIITSYQKGLEAVKESQDTIEEMKESHSTVRITHEFDVNAEDFMRDGLTLGTIEVTRTKREFPQLPGDPAPAEG